MNENVWYIAHCVDCYPDRRDLVQPFRDHEARAKWVGEHRVATGHNVHMWIEAR